MLPYDLVIKDVFPENIRLITEFSQKTGDYPNLSATDIKVMALTYQLEKAEVGIDHIRKEPLVKKFVSILSKPLTEKENDERINLDVSGFYLPKRKEGNVSEKVTTEIEPLKLDEQSKQITVEVEKLKLQSDDKEENESELTENLKDDLILPIDHNSESSEYEEGTEDEDDDGWITPSNLNAAKKQMNSSNLEEKSVKVSCITTDFAMQNVLKQMNLNVSALDGRLIKELKTYILRCYACFKTTSLMMQRFCPKCGNATLKRVSVSVDSNGKQRIHINARRPLTARGKKFSLPRVQGGKHSNNPILVADQPLPDQKATRLARIKNNPLGDDYIAGYSPFVMRDVNSKSAQLGIRSVKEVKHWMKKNPNETSRRRK